MGLFGKKKKNLPGVEKYFRNGKSKAEKARAFSAMFLLYLTQKKELQHLPSLSTLTLLPADLSGSTFLLNGKKLHNAYKTWESNKHLSLLTKRLTSTFNSFKQGSKTLIEWHYRSGNATPTQNVTQTSLSPSLNTNLVLTFMLLHQLFSNTVVPSISLVL